MRDTARLFTPTLLPEAFPYPILRCLSSTRPSRAAPRYAVLRAARTGCRGVLGAPHEPWARRGRRRGVLGRAPEGATQKSVCISYTFDRISGLPLNR